MNQYDLPKQKSAVTRVNQQLKAQGRAERLVRGRGYYYLMGGDAAGFPSTSIYTYTLEPQDYAFAASEVADIFKRAGIAVAFEKE